MANFKDGVEFCEKNRKREFLFCSIIKDEGKAFRTAMRFLQNCFKIQAALITI